MGSTTTTRRSHRLRALDQGRNPTIERGQEKTRTRRPWPRRRDTTSTQDRHRHRRYCLAMLVCVGVLTPMVTSSEASAHTLNYSRKQYRGIMPDAYYNALGRCETGSRRGDLMHSTLNYTGAYGLARGTAWRWSGHRDVTKFNRKKQVEIADRIAFKGWTNKAGKYVAPVGPFGWSVVKNGCEKLLVYLCHNNHRLVQKHRSRACQLGGGHR